MSSMWFLLLAHPHQSHHHSSGWGSQFLSHQCPLPAHFAVVLYKKRSMQLNKPSVHFPHLVYLLMCFLPRDIHQYQHFIPFFCLFVGCLLAWWGWHASLLVSHCVLNLFICKAIVCRQRVCVCECGVALTLNVCVPAMMRRALPQKTCRMPQSAWSRRKAAWKARQLLAVLKQGQTPHTHPVTRVKLVSADQRRPPSLQAVGDFKSVTSSLSFRLQMNQLVLIQIIEQYSGIASK